MVTHIARMKRMMAMAQKVSSDVVGTCIVGCDLLDVKTNGGGIMSVAGRR